MKRTDAIANEMEFQELLASAWESERQRPREEAAARDSQQYTSFEVAKEKCNEGDTAS